MKYTDKQQVFMGAVVEGRNTFLTGKAGTGKSFIVKQAIEQLKKAGQKVVAVAPTGVAANNIGGQTIHSMFQLSPFGVLSFETCNYLSKVKKDVLQKADTIIIDEVSMLRPDVLDAMHLTLKKNGLKGLPDRQIVFVGDLKQLPPPIDDNMMSVLHQTYNGEFFTFSNIFPRLNVALIELDEIMRQADPDFIENLNIVREGGKSEYFRRFLHKEQKGIVLAPHNSTVNAYNEAGLQSQPGKLFTFKAQIEGTAKPEDFSLENEIRVKTGCKIMYLVNSKENPLRNGTIGEFLERDGTCFIKVGRVEYSLKEVVVTKKEYRYNKDKDELELQEVGSITQYPFKLAYAISIHKAQGLTFEEVTIDLRRPCFQKGQLYTAISRATGPEGLRIIM